MLSLPTTVYVALKNDYKGITNLNRITITVIGSAIFAMVLAGCSDSADDGAASQDLVESGGNHGAEIVSDDDQPAKEISKWVLPTDKYVRPDIDLINFQSETTELLTAKCMRENGFPEYKSFFDLAAPYPETRPNGVASPIFTDEIAGKYGYRNAPDPQMSELDVEERAYDPDDQAFSSQWNSCNDAALELMPIPPNPAEENGGQAASESVGSQLGRLHADRESSDLQEAAGKWRSCMQPLGIVDLPSSPWQPRSLNDMPQSLVEKWQWSPGGVPTSDEVLVAVQDSKCRQSSGWTETLYDAEWEVAHEFVNKWTPELDAILSETEAQMDIYRKIRSDHLD